MADDVVLLELAKSRDEVVRVLVREFKGHRFADLRTYFRDTRTDELRPTAKGVSLRADMLRQVAEALLAAEATLRGEPE